MNREVLNDIHMSTLAGPVQSGWARMGAACRHRRLEDGHATCAHEEHPLWEHYCEFDACPFIRARQTEGEIT